ncbi:MAG: hypothetical protein R2744_08035 [Bacteroidales bacterium]
MAVLGDAIHLTTVQTFYKNIIILLFRTSLYLQEGSTPHIDSKSEWRTVILVSVLFISFSLLNYVYLPVVDFRPYKVGWNIPEAMEIPPDTPFDQYDTRLIYEKDGVQKEFTLDNYPSGDSSWVFVDQLSILVKKGYEPPIHDFILTSQEGYDMTDFMLLNPGVSFIMISNQISEANRSLLERGIGAGLAMQDKG